MLYIIRKGMRGKTAWLFFLAVIITFVQIAGNIALPLLMNNLAKILEGDSLIRIANKYYQQIPANDLANPHATVTVLTSAGMRVEDGILLAIMVGVAFIAFLAGSISGIMGSKIATTMVRNLRIEMYNNIQYFSRADFDQLHISTLITRLTTDIFTIEQAMIFILRVGFRAIFMYIGGIIGTIIVIVTSTPSVNGIEKYEWVVPITVIVSSVITMSVVAFVIYRSVILNQRKMVATDETNNVMREAILGIRVVKSFNLQDVQKQKFAGVNEKLAKISQRAMFVSELGFPGVNFIMSVTVAAILGLGTLTKTIGITEVITLIQLVTLMMVGLILFVVTLAQIGASGASARRVREVLAHKPVIQFDPNGKEITDGSIEFKNVTFSYNETGEEPVLKNINLKINSGETIGIIGGTGSGKTTLVSLIARIYDIKEGELLISGQKCHEISEESLRSSIAVAPQNVIIFSGTIASNLDYGKPGATLEEMERAAKTAEAYSFIQGKEGMFDAHVEQRGENFSGGQKQRLSIARAVIKDSKILIFDDSTSALDMITERNVQHHLKEDKPGVTKIIVAQRLSAVRHADKVIVLEDGRIVGEGNHLELLRSCEAYQEIAYSQIGREGVQRELEEAIA